MKRAFDIVVAVLAMVVTSPLVLVGAIAVKVQSPGPAFYRGPRVGRSGTPFRIYKLRTMSVGADTRGPAVTVVGDARVTRVGRMLRRTKIDELPQLLNVLKGDMSMVGPRPEHPDLVQRYTPEQRRVLTVRPGITGPASVAFIDEEELLAGVSDPVDSYVANVMQMKLALDLAYVNDPTLASDLKILGRTLAVMVTRLATRGGREPRR